MRRFPARPVFFASLLVALSLSPLQASAQILTASVAPDAASSTSSSLPDAPGQASQPQSGPTQTDSEHLDPQTKRILGIIPNFRAVSANTHLPSQTVKDKFVTATEDSFDYSSLVLPAVIAGYSELENSTPEFHGGAPGYGRYFWHTFVDQTDENYMVEFIVPAITHEDTRYYTLGKGGFLKRAGYSLSRAVITRNDAGHDTFNIAEVGGAAAAAAISNLYYPRPERTFSNTADKWATNVGIDAGTFFFKEFWPDINHFLFHGQKPMQTNP
jgi:hypothetical protein